MFDQGKIPILRTMEQDGTRVQPATQNNVFTYNVYFWDFFIYSFVLWIFFETGPERRVGENNAQTPEIIQYA